MLDVDGLRGSGVTSGLGDDELQGLLDAAYEAIVLFAGPPGDVTELIVPGPGDLLMLSRGAAEIGSVIEIRFGTETTLATDDYELIGDQMLRRLRGGTHPSWLWRGPVKVLYTAQDDEASRDRVAIALVQQDLNHNPGLTSQRLGEWSETFAGGSADSDYAAERSRILATLYPMVPAI